MTAMTREQLLELPAILDVDAAAAALGVSPWTVRQMAARGELPTLRLGRLVRIRLVDVLALAGVTTPDMSEAGPASPTVAATAEQREERDVRPDQSARPLRLAREI